MSRTWLLLDCPFLCHRAYHAMGALSHGPEATEVVFNFLLQVRGLQEQFNTPHVAFCWDYGTLHRETYYPGYKATRRLEAAKWDDVERGRRAQFRCQMKRIRSRYLRAIGYRNIFWQDGYEADDIIAAVAAVLSQDEAIIVSSDKDLYQLLNHNVRIYNPAAKKGVGAVTTLQSFVAEWGIVPVQWPKVKALAGCGTDDVEGLPGVGEITAVKYLRGALPVGGKLLTTIDADIYGPREASVVRRNMPLVRLPWPGVQEFELVPDEVTPEGWAKVCDRLGMRSLRGRPPVAGRGWGHRKGLL